MVAASADAENQPHDALKRRNRTTRIVQIPEGLPTLGAAVGQRRKAMKQILARKLVMLAARHRPTKKVSRPGSGGATPTKREKKCRTRTAR